MSFVNPFLASRFHACLKVLHEPYEVSTLVGESIVAQRVYRNYLISILHRVVPCDLVKISMVNFDVILRMD